VRYEVCDVRYALRVLHVLCDVRNVWYVMCGCIGLCVICYVSVCVGCDCMCAWGMCVCVCVACA